MRPTRDIADSAVRSASCTHHCATETPNGDAALWSTGEVERPLDCERRHKNVEFGAADDIIVELPSKRFACRTDNAMSSNILPIAYYELECAVSCECICTDFPDGSDVLY